MDFRGKATEGMGSDSFESLICQKWICKLVVLVFHKRLKFSMLYLTSADILKCLCASPEVEALICKQKTLQTDLTD